MNLDRDLAAYRARCCTGKQVYDADEARQAASRARGLAHGIEAYRCPFAADHAAGAWHIGHALTQAGLHRVAALLRARSGNRPVPPGTGTTRRQRLREGRSGAW